MGISTRSGDRFHRFTLPLTRQRWGDPSALVFRMWYNVVPCVRDFACARVIIVLLFPGQLGLLGRVVRLADLSIGLAYCVDRVIVAKEKATVAFIQSIRVMIACSDVNLGHFVGGHCMVSFWPIGLYACHSACVGVWWYDVHLC